MSLITLRVMLTLDTSVELTRWADGQHSQLAWGRDVAEAIRVQASLLHFRAWVKRHTCVEYVDDGVFVVVTS